MRFCILFVLLVAAMSCSAASEELKGETMLLAPPVSKQTADGKNGAGKPSGTTMERGDLNGDKRPDVWTYAKEIPDPLDPKRTKQVMVKKEADLNFDGSKDILVEYDQNGSVSREIFDFDFDGKNDQENIYKGGKIAMKRLYAPATGKVFIWKYFEDGLLSRVSTDDNGDSLADRCEEWFKGQRLIRRGRDTNKDGDCDDWTAVR